MLTPEQDGYLARYAALVNSTGLSNDTLGSTIIAVNLELAALRQEVEAQRAALVAARIALRIYPCVEYWKTADDAVRAIDAALGKEEKCE